MIYCATCGHEGQIHRSRPGIGCCQEPECTCREFVDVPAPTEASKALDLRLRACADEMKALCDLLIDGDIRYLTIWTALQSTHTIVTGLLALKEHEHV